MIAPLRGSRALGLILVASTAGAATVGTAALGTAAAQVHELTSPDGRTHVRVDTDGALTWAVSRDGRALLEPSGLSMTFEDGRVIGPKARVEESWTRAVDDVVRPVVPEKNAIIPERFQELRIAFHGDWDLIVRAYDEGVAYRFATRFQGRTVVTAEEATFRFDGDHRVVWGADSLWMSHQEPVYRRVRLDSLTAGGRALTPLVLEVDEGRAS